MAWNEWIRTVEIEPSLYAADFANLGEQIDILLRTGARIFHFDVGDGHFVEPITIGPIVLQAISPIVHGMGGVIDCHLMVDNPTRHFPQIARAGGDSVTFHYEAVDDVPATIAVAREHGLQVGIAFNPETRARRRREGCRRCRSRSLHEHPPGLLGPEVHGWGARAHQHARGSSAGDDSTCRSTAASTTTTSASIYDAGATLIVAGAAIFHREDPAALVSAVGASARVNYFERALELAERGRGQGRGSSARRRGRRRRRATSLAKAGTSTRAVDHAEVRALAQAGERARGATLYVTLEPCAHHGRTPPCVDAVIDAGIARVVVGALDPNPVAAGGLETAARRRDRGRVARQRRGAPPERGVAHVEGARTSVRHVQGRGDARRPRLRARASLDLGRGVAAPRPRASRRVGRGRRRHGHRPRRRAPPRRPRRRCRAPAAPARVRPRPAPGRIRARAAQRPARGRAPRARGRRCPVAPARGWPDARDGVLRGRSRRQAAPLRRAHRRRAKARASSATRSISTCRSYAIRRVGEDILLEAYVHRV